MLETELQKSKIQELYLVNFNLPISDNLIKLFDNKNYHISEVSDNQIANYDFALSEISALIYNVDSENPKVLEYCKTVNSQNAYLPIFIFGSLLSEEYKIEALENGCSHIFDTNNISRESLAYIERRIKDYNNLLQLKSNLVSKSPNDTEINVNLWGKQGFRSLFKHASVGIVLGNLSGNIINANNYIENLTGLKIDELVGLHLKNLFTPESVKKVPLRFDKLRKGKSVISKRQLKQKNGTIITIEMHSSQINKEEYLSFFYDVSSKEKVESSLRESEEKYRTLFENSNDPTLLMYDNKFIDCNESAEKILGLKRREIFALHPSEISPKFQSDGTTSVSKADKMIDKAITNGFHKFEWDHINSKGETFPVEINLTRINVDGKLMIYVVWHDLSEIKNRTKALFESESNFRVLAESTSTGIIIYDTKSVLYANKAFCNISSFTEKEMIKMSFWEITHPEHLELVKQRGIDRLNGKKVISKYEIKILTKEGIVKWLEISASPIQWHGKDCGVASCIEITKRKNAYLQLAENEERYRAIFDLSPGGILLMDEFGVIIDANETICEEMGYIRENLKGKHISILADDKRTPFIDNNLERIVSGENLHHIVTNRSKDGSCKIRELHETRVKLSDGSYGVMSVSMDITEKYKSEQIKQALLNVSNAAVESISLFELNRVVREELSVLIDTSNLFIATYDEEENEINFPFMSDDNNEIKEIKKVSANNSLTGHVIKTKKSLLVDNTVFDKLCEEGIIEKLGSPSQIWIGVPLITKGKAVGAIVIQDYESEDAFSTDDLELLEIIAIQISVAIERKKYEEGLKFSLEKAKETDRLKSSFLATMSHELRTPLNAVIGFSSLINPKTDYDNVSTYAKTINQSGNHLLGIVEDIFDITLIEAGQISIYKENVNLNILLNELYGIIKAEQFELGKNSIEIIFDVPSKFDFIELYTDKRRFSQILLNILKNALKFTTEGSIEFGYDLDYKVKEGFLLFHVKDSGIGIPKSKQDLIFDVFRQVDDTNTRMYGGVGLGLSVTKKLIDLLGGNIWVESDSGKGSTFYFTLPILEGERVIVIDTDVNSFEMEVLNGKTFLIADDMEDSYKLLEILLESEGVNCIKAENGREAVTKVLENDNIDMVLMDLNMPVMNGYDATGEIKLLKPNLPIIAQTAYAISGERQKSIEAGCDDYIEKPIDRDLLFLTIIKWLK